MDDQKVETPTDFLQCLETDMSLHIMSFLHDPGDLVRASACSRFWRKFVISNGLTKQLCLKTFPEVSSIAGIVNPTKEMPDSVEVESSNAVESEINSTTETRDSVEVKSSNPVEWEILERDHMVYASLLQALTKSKVFPKDCIANAISASSTDNYPDESIVNTLNPRDRFIRRASYWSSKGQSNPAVPETLIYKLRAGIWVVTEVDIQPFEAFFQPGNPIYSAKFVRFRMGYPKNPREIGNDFQHLPLQKPADDKFVWTYTSPEFPMVQENRLQPFKLPEPVICIGGYLQIEFLERVQTQEMDGLYYICVCYVRVLGRTLYPAFDTKILEPHGKPSLKFYPENLSSILKSHSSEEIPNLRILEEEMLQERISLLENFLRGIQHGPNNPFVWDDDEDDGDGGLIL